MNASMQCSCIRVGLHPRFVGLYTQPSKISITADSVGCSKARKAMSWALERRDSVSSHTGSLAL